MKWISYCYNSGSLPKSRELWETQNNEETSADNQEKNNKPNDKAKKNKNEMTDFHNQIFYNFGYNKFYYYFAIHLVK